MVPHLLRFWREAQVGIDLPLGEEPYRLGSWMRDEVNVLARVQAHICHHAGEKDVPGGIQLGHGDDLSLQITDGVDLVRPEQFEAAYVKSCQDDDGVTRLQAEEERCSKVPVEVGFAGGEGLLDVCGPRFLEVVHLGEPFATQQFFGHILRGLTDARDLNQSDSRRFGRRLRGH
jgi:hypothetical protein